MNLISTFQHGKASVRIGFAILSLSLSAHAQQQPPGNGSLNTPFEISTHDHLALDES